jgi:hypothetical protein
MSYSRARLITGWSSIVCTVAALGLLYLTIEGYVPRPLATFVEGMAIAAGLAWLMLRIAEPRTGRLYEPSVAAPAVVIAPGWDSRIGRRSTVATRKAGSFVSCPVPVPRSVNDDSLTATVTLPSMEKVLAANGGDMPVKEIEFRRVTAGQLVRDSVDRLPKGAWRDAYNLGRKAAFREARRGPDADGETGN